MANTTNFGWETPDDTDLVKDGAAAIRTLGSAIDTSLVDLKGGTTGQILSKTSNTDMDFTWITNDVGDITAVTAGTGISGGGSSGAVTITNSMATAIDAKGDLIAGTGADAFDRLAVGTNGQILSADSTATTGLKWIAAPSAGANWTLLNTGGTSLSGTTTTVSGISGADKIFILIDGASTGSNASTIYVRLNGDTGNNYAFGSSELVQGSTYAVGNLAGYGGTSYSLVPIGRMSSIDTSVVKGYFLLSGGNASGVKVFNFAGSGNASTSNSQIAYAGGGYYNSSSTISSISIYGAGGTFDAGTVYVYTSA